jgi:uncharacterized protein YneF (UPF0154 family)
LIGAVNENLINIVMSDFGKKHLEENNETYYQHGKFAFVYGWKLLMAALASFIHGIFPGIFVAYSANTVKKIYHVILKKDSPSER